MGTAKRAYDILRGWVGTEWDRIREIEHDLATNELDEAMDKPAPARNRKPSEPVPSAMSAEDADTHARRILGVGEAASFEEIRKAFDRLNQRSEPTKFPENSAERNQAAEIQKRIHWAYQQLTAKFDTVEKRFRSLEI